MHQFRRIVKADVIRPGELSLTFDDGVVKEVDLKPVMFGGLFGALRDSDFFEKVAIDDEVGTVFWPNGADFDPDSLYTWENQVKVLSSQLTTI